MHQMSPHQLQASPQTHPSGSLRVLTPSRQCSWGRLARRPPPRTTLPRRTAGMPRAALALRRALWALRAAQALPRRQLLRSRPCRQWRRPLQRPRAGLHPPQSHRLKRRLPPRCPDWRHHGRLQVGIADTSAEHAKNVRLDNCDCLNSVPAVVRQALMVHSSWCAHPRQRYTALKFLAVGTGQASAFGGQPGDAPISRVQQLKQVFEGSSARRPGLGSHRPGYQRPAAARPAPEDPMKEWWEPVSLPKHEAGTASHHLGCRC